MKMQAKKLSSYAVLVYKVGFHISIGETFNRVSSLKKS